MPENVKGSVLFLNLYDVCEEIRLDTVRNLLGATPQPRSFKHAAPEYVRFERPPVVESIAVNDISIQQVPGQVKYYDYGVISVLLEVPFQESLDDVVRLASKWMSSTDFESASLRIVQEKVKTTGQALVRRYAEWTNEDYYVFQFHEISGVTTADVLLSAYGDKIAQIIRGETVSLSKSEQAETLQARISYYPTDLVVMGWNASVVYDTPSGAQNAVQLVEYANSQLLEFRYYDEFLTRELASVYGFLRRRRGLLSRWSLPKQMAKLQSIDVEVSELVERVDNSIKFVSDMFSAKLYRLAADKVGVPDYKSLVNQKLRTVEELYRSLNDEFQASRGFILEAMVVIILVIELVFLFRGK
jgi:hypothetical protein